MKLGTAEVIRANSRHLPIADDSVDLVVTSPPYFCLRSYQDGGEHYAGQIGDEPTPAEFVASLLEVTRECVRVLKPSGSLWVNLGDRYSGGEPYDNTLTVGDAAWLAGLIDADGTITVRRTQQPQMRAVTFEGIVSVEQMDREAVERAAAITGKGAVYEVNGSRGRTMYRWTASTQQARWVAERIWPWLRIKQRQALAVAELGRHRETCQARGRHTPIKPEWVEYRETICAAVRSWNRREPHDWQPPLLPVIDLPNMPRRIAPKSLSGLPWRYALACIDDLGLILRAEVIWSKPNGLPESVTDRVRRSHEQWFHFTLEPRYFSAVDEIREPHDGGGKGMTWAERKADPNAPKSGWREASDRGSMGATGTFAGNPLGKLPGSVWTVPTEPLRVPDHLGIDHFAAFPTEFPRRIIQGWSPAGVCVQCGEGRRPVAAKDAAGKDRTGPQARRVIGYQAVDRADWQESVTRVITGYACACPEPTADTTPGRVLDPFGGTTALVAKALGRHGITVDMSADYGRLARWRVSDRDQLAKVLGVAKAEQQDDGQMSMFELDGPTPTRKVSVSLQGDRTCPHCGYRSQYARKPNCDRCGAPRNEAAS